MVEKSLLYQSVCKLIRLQLHDNLNPLYQTCKFNIQYLLLSHPLFRKLQCKLTNGIKENNSFPNLKENRSRRSLKK